MLYIESRSNPKIKEVILLSDRRERQLKKLFFFEGIHLLEEYLRAGMVPETVFVTENAFSKYEILKSIPENRIIKVSDSVYEKMTDEKSPQGVFTVSKYLENIRYGVKANPGSIIAESVRDPGNLGGIIRTGAALGSFDFVISDDSADIYSSKAIRASMGAVFFSDITVTPSVIDTVKELIKENNRVFAACLYGKTSLIGEFEIKKSDSFVVGNEGQGITESVASCCTERVIIPMTGKTESLNVAAAATVIMWEMSKVRK